LLKKNKKRRKKEGFLISSVEYNGKNIHKSFYDLKIKFKRKDFIYNFIKFNIVTCMKVTGETLYLLKKEREPKRKNTKCI
jgi:hypothetical protein